MSFHVALVRADSEARLRNALVLAGLLLWMLYTRVFWNATSVHATLPTCPFLAITGHPCPFCGGTRSFAFMWRGDAGHAAALYPLGPGLFLATVLAIPILILALLFDRDLAVRAPDALRRAGILATLGVLLCSWTLKLTLLPN